MATAIDALPQGCYRDLGTQMADSFAVTEYYKILGILQYIKIRQMPCASRWESMYMTLPNFRENCGPTNHPSPTATFYDKRYGSMCSHELAIKLCDDHIISSCIELQSWLAEIMRQLWFITPAYILQIIYNSLGDDVTVRQKSETTGRFQDAVLTYDQDVKTSAIDVSTGFTIEKFFEILGEAAKYGLGRRLIFILPYKAVNLLRQNLISTGHCCMSIGQLSEGFDVMTSYGNVTILHPFEGQLGFKWREVGGKVRGYVFFENAIELAYTDKSTVSYGNSDSRHIYIRPSRDNGFLNGKIDINADGRAGGIDLYAKINVGGLRIDPHGVIAIDFDKSKVL